MPFGSTKPYASWQLQYYYTTACVISSCNNSIQSLQYVHPICRTTTTHRFLQLQRGRCYDVFNGCAQCYERIAGKAEDTPGLISLSLTEKFTVGAFIDTSTMIRNILAMPLHFVNTGAMVVEFKIQLNTISVS